jgi:outer membrane protein OmpU
MNTLKKIGLTALGTSLVAGSAYAGEITASGDAGYTFKSEEIGVRSDEGYGYNHDITFSGSGELDNGWSVSTTMILVEGATLSSSNVALTMGGMGTITVGGGLGNVGGGFDAVTPFAYEENHDGMATTTAIDSLGSLSDGNSVMYAAPALELGGATLNITAGYTPEAGDAVTGEGAVSAQSGNFGSAKTLGAKVSMAGLTAGIFGEEVDGDTDDNSVSGASRRGDAMSATWFANYSFGPVSVGYQKAGLDHGINAASTAATTAKTIAAAGGFFESEMMSIAFNVNENLSISYGELTETYNAQDNASTAIANVDMESDSIQFAYTMGSMSIKGYQTETDNPGWDSDADSNTETEIAVNFAF